jgi:serine/threonine protein kinase
VKVFKPRPGNDNAEAVERFKREGISISRLSHPNIITVLDSGVSAQGIAYLVMELLKGVSLAQELRAIPATTLKHCLERVVPVCRALAEAHRLGIIHRDIKPDNIFVNYTMEGEVIKVVDFGIAKMMADDTGENLETLTGTNNLIGTPTYMAPERLASKPYDGGSDVYSLGVVLYELLAGRPPFEKTLSGLVGMMLKHIKDAPTPLRELNPFIPPSIEEIVARTLQKEPSLRPTARELGDQLMEALNTLPREVLNQPFDRLSPMEAFVSTRYSENP